MNFRSSDLLQLSSEIIHRGCCLRFMAKGHSMHPFIKDGEVVVVKPIGIFEIKKGDVILYHTSLNMIAHRVIKRKRENNKIMLVTKGDSNLNFDTLVQENNILGKIIAIEKPNGTINLDCNKWYICNYMIAIYSLLFISIYKDVLLLKKVGDRNNRFIELTLKNLYIPFFLSLKLLTNLILFAQNIRLRI